ncbi:DUF4190 domain-containing protein [Streptomyces sp. NPDC090021]|uniref:DUF4190 domain-containing protein n=1 Tax=Streptomyces sp. NPDC090021 TaxID=3365919 RepID=UPI003800B094
MSVPPPSTGPTPPQQPGPPPYGTHGGGPWLSQPSPVPTLNGLAVAALVLSLTVCLTPLGLVLGIVALVQISGGARRGRPQRGRGLAIAGVAVSASVIVIAALLMAFADFRVWTVSSPDRGTDGKVEQRSTATVLDLREGDCFTPGSGLPKGDRDPMANLAVELIPCDRPHEGEVYGITRIDGPAAFPGTEAVAAQARTRCVPLLLDYIPDPDAQPGTKTFFYHPDEQGWQAGRRTVVCWVSGSGHSTSASIQQDLAAMEPGQRAYLTAIRPLSTALLSRPPKSPAQDLAGAREWARMMPGAIDETARLLEQAQLPAAARGPARALAEKLRASRPDWVDAGAAKNVDELRKALAKVDEHPIQEDVTRVRTGLGLPTTGAGGGRA